MNDKEKILLAIERAADDLRRGWPVVVISRSGTRHIITPLEGVTSEALERFEAYGALSEILITHHRARTLKVAHKGLDTVRIEKSPWLTATDMQALADPTLDLANPLMGPFSRTENDRAETDTAAIQLIKFAHLLPALLIAEVKARVDSAIEIKEGDILSFEYDQAHHLKQVAAAQVPLEGSENTKLIAFRPLVGGLEHIAIVVGEIDVGKPVLARIHSECFTGDMLGSLKCDCGQQLKGAIKAIDEAGGGVLLYLAQEGRGIGLVSKLKAYSLQDQGYDTVDANTRLGFDIDERVYAPAAEMLRQLSIKSVNLMTNNPEKLEALGRFGIDVAGRVEHAFPTNPHNEHYLAVKKSKTGHLL